MRAGLEGIQHELGLPPAEVQDPGHAPGNRVVDGRKIVIHEQVMVARSGSLDDTIPRGVSGILHLGRGQTEFVLDSLKPGPHRVIAVVADWKHLPLKPPVIDTVRFTVK